MQKLFLNFSKDTLQEDDLSTQLSKQKNSMISRGRAFSSILTLLANVKNDTLAVIAQEQEVDQPFLLKKKGNNLEQLLMSLDFLSTTNTRSGTQTHRMV